MGVPREETSCSADVLSDENASALSSRGVLAIEAYGVLAIEAQGVLGIEACGVLGMDEEALHGGISMPAANSNRREAARTGGAWQGDAMGEGGRHAGDRGSASGGSL